MLLPDAGWSWFENARAAFGGDGTTLYASAVADPSSAPQPPGMVLLTEVAIPSGARRLVPLGKSHVDDHNSASILEADTREVLTAWTGHHRSPVVNPQRRRTDGSWLLLPPIEVSTNTTYSNLFRTPSGDGGPDVVYDFYRGERSDPNVLRSTDVGRTWEWLGRLLKDPDDLVGGRPYVVYEASGDGRIDLIATEAHPRDYQTSIYHGYIEGGQLHRSDGTVITDVGTPVSVTELTRVWAPSGSERGWTSDIVIDPATGDPVAVFSVRHSLTDHRYWYARYSGGEWTAREVAFAGDALFEREEDYTGLIALDPRDPDRMVISTDVDPDTGDPLVSASDGEVHWELFEGTRNEASGGVAWTPLTQDSKDDHLRPVFATDPSGASALLWMRGSYPSFTSYDTDIVGVVRTAGGAPVLAGPVQTVMPLQVLPDPVPQPTAGQPLVGDFDAHGADDLFLYRRGTGLEQLLLGDEQRRPTPVAARSVTGTYQPLPGDYDGDGDTDIYWYAPGPAKDSLWLADHATFTTVPTRGVGGTYVPVPGDHDADGDTDIFWYGPSTAKESLWLADHASFTPVPTRGVSGLYRPIAGDYDGDHDTDVFWYAPGSAKESLWLADHATFTNAPVPLVNGTYAATPGDYDGDGDTDIHWYATGSLSDFVWWWDGATPISERAALNL